MDTVTQILNPGPIVVAREIALRSGYGIKKREATLESEVLAELNAWCTAGRPECNEIEMQNWTWNDWSKNGIGGGPIGRTNLGGYIRQYAYRCLSRINLLLSYEKLYDRTIVASLQTSNKP
jgi:hypothetical protein